MGILSREGVAGQGIRRCGGLTRLPCITHFALAQHRGGTGFVSHLRDLRACCIGGDGGETQMVSQEVFLAQLCQGASLRDRVEDGLNLRFGSSFVK